MTNYEKALELKEKIRLWVQQREHLDECIESACHEIDQLQEDEQKLKNEAIELHS